MVRFYAENKKYTTSKFEEKIVDILEKNFKEKLEKDNSFFNDFTQI